jgi:hypothetical protein
VARATPCPKNGVAGPPHFWPKGGRPPHTGRIRPPQAFGGGPATPERPKKKKTKNGFGILGVAGPPPRAWGWLRTPPTTGRGWLKPPPCPWGWSGHPQNPKPVFRFFFFWPFRGGRTTPKGLGWPNTAGMGWPATPWPKMGWSSHPIFWARGGSSHPDFPPPPFFSISFFFQKKKKKKPKMQNYAVLPKTASFWTSPKRRSFGVEGIMGIYIFIYPLYP